MNHEYTGKELVLEFAFDVTTADCDMFARLRPGGLVSFLIVAATRSADELGFGYEFLSRHHLYWVLSRMTIEICRPLLWGDKAVVITWPKDVDGLLYLRDFEVKDQNGEMVARATSGWLAMDMDSKRPRKVEDKFSYMFDQMKDKSTWFDFDLNKHVTSSRYIDWMVDNLPTDVLINRYPVSLSVNYLKETMLGEVTTLTVAMEPVGSYLFEGISRVAEKPSFRGRIEF